MDAIEFEEFPEAFEDPNEEEMGIDIGEFLTGVITMTKDDAKHIKWIIDNMPKDPSKLNKNAYTVLRRVITDYRTPKGGYGSVKWAHQDFAPGGFSVWIPIGYSIWDVQASYQAEIEAEWNAKGSGVPYNPWREVFIKREIVTGWPGVTFDMLSSIPLIGWIFADAVELYGEISDYYRLPVYENLAFTGTISEQLVENNWDKVLKEITKIYHQWEGIMTERGEFT